ncbi:hypothetical protein JIN85_16550 [Luteolibacter pohnpeiensis]|uniref:Uncharacterized protein n=1 Tax=Luteolibacter pohnpeiensis TaxID=454153 RepID=A0A934VS88_9BACT|nr:hypothetical protein [Luteolibacter pohnpeiensis]MBK1884031.1 hypothetical protein [Luteolibacter pohnpeiensis]
MKRFLTAIASALGLTAVAAPEIKMIDPKTIYFSLATINDTLPELDQVAERRETDFVLHEDDWRQFEAVSHAFDAEIKEEISGVQRIFSERSKPSGEYRIFSEIHIRKQITQPLPSPLEWSELLAACRVPPASVARVGLQGQGLIKDGFSFRVGSLTLFGIRHDSKVEILCFDLTSTPSLSDAEAQRLASFFDKSHLVAVHWPSATVLAEKQALVSFLMQTDAK